MLLLGLEPDKILSHLRTIYFFPTLNKESPFPVKG